MSEELTAPKLRVTLADGQVLELQTQNPDLVRWDLTRPVEKWPTVEDAPFLWMTFIAYCAAKRLNLYAGNWKDWHSKDCLDLTDLTEDDGEKDPALDPTQPDPEPGSA